MSGLKSAASARRPRGAPASSGRPIAASNAAGGAAASGGARSTRSSPSTSPRPPGPIGVPVTHQRCVARMRAAISAAAVWPPPTICASSHTRRHQESCSRGDSGTR